MRLQALLPLNLQHRNLLLESVVLAHCRGRTDHCCDVCDFPVQSSAEADAGIYRIIYYYFIYKNDVYFINIFY